MRLTAVLFDLDGTLTESGEGIMNAARAGLSAVGREAGDSKALKKLIGPPLSEGFSQIYGLGSEEIPNAIRAFRAYYESKGIFENKLYPGAAELLQTLEVSGTVSCKFQTGVSGETGARTFFTRHIFCGCCGR